MNTSISSSKTILITGGAGYIGSHTNKELSNKGYGTIVFDNLSRGHKEFVKWGDLVIGDLADVGSLKRVFELYPIKAVMHFAAFAYVAESFEEPALYYSNNVLNTINLLSLMRDFGIRHFIFSSSCATYGNPVSLPVAETHPRNPISPYGRTKYMVENILDDHARAYGLRYVSLRYFNAAGADVGGEVGERHSPETHLIPLVLEAASGERQYVEIFGSDYDTPDGTCIRDYVHVTDLADAHILALEYLLQGGDNEVFNVGTGRGYSINEVIRAAENITGCNIPLKASARRKGDPAVLVSSPGKIMKTLSWQPKFDNLNAILNTAWNWHRIERGRHSRRF